jgi:hypothetical protein
MRVMVSAFLRRTVPVLFAGALLLGAVGCGGARTADVTGTVKIKGKAPNIKGLRIGFVQGGGEAITAEVKADGKYRAIGVPAGQVKVFLIQEQEEADVLPFDPAQFQGPAAPPPLPTPDKGGPPTPEGPPDRGLPPDKGGPPDRLLKAKGAPPGPAKGKGPPRLPKLAFPEKYAFADRSGLSFTVEAGKPNVFDVDLTD